MKAMLRIPIGNKEQWRHINKAVEELKKGGVIFKCNNNEEDRRLYDMGVVEWVFDDGLKGALLDEVVLGKKKGYLSSEIEEETTKVTIGSLDKISVNGLKGVRAGSKDCIIDAVLQFSLVDFECRSRIVRQWRVKKWLEQYPSKTKADYAKEVEEPKKRKELEGELKRRGI